jgi:hypothetical protein
VSREGRQKWPKLLHVAQKYLKNTKKTKEKQVEGEDEISKGERGEEEGAF